MFCFHIRVILYTRSYISKKLNVIDVPDTISGQLKYELNIWEFDFLTYLRNLRIRLFEIHAFTPHSKSLPISFTTLLVCLSRFVTNRKDAKSDDYLTSHTYHPCMCKLQFSSLWLVEFCRKDARDRTRARSNEHSSIYICMKEWFFMMAMPDNDVSSFFLSPSACDLVLLWIHYVCRWCVSSFARERRKFFWFAEIISQHIFCPSSPYNIMFSFAIYFFPASV